MYEELIKRLGKRAVNLKEEFSRNAELLSELMEAADAIEELEKLTDAQLDIIKQHQAYLTKPRWIPVTERLPEKFKDVLTYGKYGIMVDKYIGQFCGEDSFALALRNVTHWMPLPTPPKEET